jgi:hypothetical protein
MSGRGLFASLRVSRDSATPYTDATKVSHQKNYIILITQIAWSRQEFSANFCSPFRVQGNWGAKSVLLWRAPF